MWSGLFSPSRMYLPQCKNKGKLGPIAILRLLLEIKHTNWISFNGVGILPEYQGLGGNAILYAELEKSMHQYPKFINSS